MRIAAICRCRRVSALWSKVSCAICSKMPHRKTPWRPRAAARGRRCASASMSTADRAGGGRRSCGAARRQAGAHAGWPGACRADARFGGGARRRMGRAARCDRSRQDAADAACQFDHRWRRRSARSGRRRGGEISRLRSCLLPRQFAARARRASGAALGSDPRLGARSARRATSCSAKASSMSRSRKPRSPPRAPRSRPIRGGSARCMR